MRELINEKVSVIMTFSAAKRRAAPYLISWQNNDYRIGEIGYHHQVRVGDDLHHIYEVVDKDSRLSFRLNFDTLNLNWTLEAISDGNAN